VWIALLCLGCLGTVAIAARLRVTVTTEQDFGGLLREYSRSPGSTAA
jgi:hypothetical protein